MNNKSLTMPFLIALGPLLLYPLMRYVALGTWENSYETRTVAVPFSQAYSVAQGAVREEGWRDRTREVSSTAHSIGLLYGEGKHFLLRPADNLVVSIQEVPGKPGLSNVTIHSSSSSGSAFALRDRVYEKMTKKALHP